MDSVPGSMGKTQDSFSESLGRNMQDVLSSIDLSTW